MQPHTRSHDVVFFQPTAQFLHPAFPALLPLAPGMESAFELATQLPGDLWGRALACTWGISLACTWELLCCVVLPGRHKGLCTV